jgi:hypothetical protein
VQTRVFGAGLALLTALCAPRLASADEDRIRIWPFVYDPGRTSLVQSGWLAGIGCPTAAPLLPFQPGGPLTFTDAGCPTGDSKDIARNEGLLLVKTGPTMNSASAAAELGGSRGIVLTELGYDIRKPAAAGATGSHCGGGAPRFNVIVRGQTHFIGCNSPAPAVAASSTGWVRLRWSGASLGAVLGQTADMIFLVFDEGQDGYGAPDQFGVAILDNIDVNGILYGAAPWRRQ